MFRNPRRWTGLLTLLAVLCLVALPSEPAWAEPRIALVIGNAAYPSAPLKNPANDASDMAAALKKLGFEVSLLKDASMQQMETAVREFGLKLRKGGTGLFYFAGHGLQVAGENYLVPVNAVIQSEGDVKYGCLNAGLVLAKMEDAGNGPNVVILDACRNNPFARSFRSAEAGLARMDAPTGSIIAYATAPGKVAADGEGRNGLYTQHLLRNIATPGLSISDLFMAVRENVVRDSGKKQVPWENTSLIGRFSLAGQVATAAPVPSPAPAPPQAVAAPVAKPAPAASVQPAFSAVPSVQPKAAPTPRPDEARLMQVMRLAWSAKHEEEREQARKLATPLVAKGSLYGSYALGWLSEDQKLQQQAITKGAKQGIPLAMVHLAEYLVDNPVSPADEAEARVWLQQALELGEPKAGIGLGSLLIEGKGGPRDVAAGERLLAEVAREHPEYNLLVGVTYSGLADKGLPKAEAKAKSSAYIRRGADLGDVNALMQLGHEYQNGWDVPKDGREAAFWFTRAAEKGSAHAMFYLGLLYRSGEVKFPADQIAAAKWFRRGAGLGDASCIMQLAEMTLLGEGVPKDVAQGLALLKGLAEKGDGYAQAKIGQAYERGIGVNKDLLQAYYWYVVADSGEERAGSIHREALAKSLTAEQRAAIEARAAKWKPRTK